MAEITFTFEVDGEPTSADSVVLSDPDGEYGFRVVDTNEVLVAVDEPMVEGDDGVYVYDLGEIEIDPQLTYEWWAKILYDNDTYWVQKFIYPTDDGENPGGTTVLRFVVVKDGEYQVLAEAPKLSNPTGSFGIAEMGTNAVIVADGTAFTANGSMYATSFTAEESIKYRYYVEAVVDSVTYFVGRTTQYTKSANLVIGRYTNSYKLEAKFGSDQIHKWLSLDDGDEPVDYAMREYDFIVQAEQELDDRLYGAFVESAYEDDIPRMIQDMATVLAGLKIYEAAGAVDAGAEGETPQQRYASMAKQLKRDLRAIKYGRIRLPGAGTPTEHPDFDKCE